MSSKNISEILMYFQVCNKTFMICSRKYSCTENEKIELISYFASPAERFTGVHFLPAISFA